MRNTKKIVAALAALIATASSAQAVCHNCSPAYRAALNRGMFGDYYRPTRNHVAHPIRPPIPPHVSHPSRRPLPPYASHQPLPPRPEIPERQITRVYLMRGLGHLSNFSLLADDLRRTGAIVKIYGWASQERVINDARKYPNDRIVVGGHSMGDWAAFRAAPHIPGAHVVGLDPLCTFPTSQIGGVNIWGSYCRNQPGTVPGAENIYIADTDHVHYPLDAEVRAAFVRATYWH